MDIRWDQDSKQQWQARLASQPFVALRQDWAFGAAMGQLGAKMGRAVILDGRQEVAIVQVLQQPGLRVIGQGPVWLKPLEPAQKRRVIRRLACHVGACIVTPQEPLAGWGLVPLITPRASALWCIDHPPERLRRGLQGKWRNRLVKAEGAVQPVPLRGQKLHELVAQEAAQRQARGYRNLPGRLALDWPGETLALGWHAGGALQAGMVFLIHGQTASYFLGWASPMARALFAHGPILWQVALALQKRGVRWLDLGDVNTDSGASLARFKLGTGAEVSTAGATCLIVPRR